jgi:hypothetical protein
VMPGQGGEGISTTTPTSYHAIPIVKEYDHLKIAVRWCPEGVWQTAHRLSKAANRCTCTSTL